MKSTSIFGGVQLFNIIIQLIRSKVVAVLLGPAGMGVLGLLQTTLSLVASGTNFGLATAAVREISIANNTNKQKQITHTISIFRKLVWFTGFFGTALTIVLSPLLSKVTFGNYNYTLEFVLLSTTLLLGQLAAGQTVLLQGLRKISWLAKANVYGSVGGLFFSLPLYFLFGIDGIVPAVIVTSLIVLFIQYLFARKIKIHSQIVKLKDALREGKGMLKLGFVVSLSSMIPIAASYIIRIFISNTGGVDQVGLYSAGFAIISTYVGMVFSAMGTDYYPRLSAVHQNTDETNILIRQQSEIALFILAPMICFFLIFIDWITILLYSEKFLPISEMVHWAILGIYFKALSWSIGFLLLAKGESKAFFWNEFAANIYLLGLNIMGYKFFGLKGLGISFLIGYFVHFFQMYFYTRIYYKLRLDFNLFLIIMMYLILGVLCFLVSSYISGWLKYLLGFSLILITGCISFVMLNKRMQIVLLIKNKMKGYDQKL